MMMMIKALFFLLGLVLYRLGLSTCAVSVVVAFVDHVWLLSHLLCSFSFFFIKLSVIDRKKTNCIVNKLKASDHHVRVFYS